VVLPLSAGEDDMARIEVEDLVVLEGDEEELQVGRHADVGRALLDTPVSEVMRRGRPVTVTPDVPVARAVELMVKRKVSAVMVVERRRPRRLAGIFTERDFLVRSATVRGLGRVPVGKVMSPAPEALRPGDGVAYALNRMAVGRFRHVPVVTPGGAPAGMLTPRDLVDFIVELCPEETLNLPSEPELAHHPEREGA
jgi:CBS domain-containing protein